MGTGRVSTVLVELPPPSPALIIAQNSLADNLNIVTV